MKRVIVIYGQAADRGAFHKHYVDVHTKLVAEMPHLLGFSYSRGDVAVSGAAAPAELVAFLDYASQADLDTSMASAPGQAAVADLANFATGGVSIFTLEVK